MKKILAVISVVCVVCIAGTALAQNDSNRRGRGNPMMNRPAMSQDMRGFPGRGPAGMRMPRSADRRGDFGGRGMPCDFGGRGFMGATFTPDMPKEIREKAAQLAKLRIDLEEALTSRPVNKEKALEAFNMIQDVKREIEAWRFTKRLERIEEMQKRRDEFMRRNPNAPAPDEDMIKPEAEPTISPEAD